MKIRTPRRLNEAPRTGGADDAKRPDGPRGIHLKKETIKKELAKAYDTLYALSVLVRKENRALDSAEAKSADGFDDRWYEHRSAIDDLESELENVVGYLKGLNEHVRDIKG